MQVNLAFKHLYYEYSGEYPDEYLPYMFFYNMIDNVLLKEMPGLEFVFRMIRDCAFFAEFHFGFPAYSVCHESARNPENGRVYGETSLRFQVGRPNLEFDRLDIDEALLKRIARETGGRYVRLYDVASVIQGLRRARRERTVQGRFAFCGPSREVWVFLAFVFLIAAEWILRKRYQLS